MRPHTPLILAVLIGCTFSAKVDSKKDKRGLLDYGTLGGYGVGGQASYRGADYGLTQAHLPLTGYGPVPHQQPIHIGTKIHTTVTRQYAVPVPHPVPVPVERHVAVPVPHPVPVAVPRPYPVAVPKPYAVPVDRPYPVPVDRPYAVPVPHPVPVHVDKPIAVPIPAPYPVGVAKPYPVGIPQPYPVAYPAHDSLFSSHFGSPFGPYGYGGASYPIKPYIRTEGLGLGLGSSIIH